MNARTPSAAQVETARMYTLADGQEVPEDSRPAMIDRHLKNLWGRDQMLRQMYLDEVERSQGREDRHQIERLYTQEWEAYVARCAAAKARAEGAGL